MQNEWNFVFVCECDCEIKESKLVTCDELILCESAIVCFCDRNNKASSL